MLPVPKIPTFNFFVLFMFFSSSSGVKTSFHYSMDFYDNLPESTLGKMLVGLNSLVEWIDCIDHRPDSGFFKHGVHFLEGTAVADGNSLNSGLPENHRHQVQCCGLAAHETDNRNVPSHPGGLHRVVDAVATHHFQ